jgi:HEAT repeat protein
VRGHVVEALGKIGGDETLAELRKRYETESNSFVRSMFKAALEGK